MKPKKQPAKSKKKAGPVTKKGTKPAQAKPRKQADAAVVSNINGKEDKNAAANSDTGLNASKTGNTNTKLVSSLVYMPIRMRVIKDLDSLFVKALTGNDDALYTLVVIANHAAMHMDTVALNNVDMAKAVAARRPAWTVNITGRHDIPNDLDELREKLKIGSGLNLPIDFTRKQFEKTTTPCRPIVRDILNLIGIMRRKQELITNIDRTKRISARYETQLQADAFTPDFVQYLDDLPEFGKSVEERRAYMTARLADLKLIQIDSSQEMPNVERWMWKTFFSLEKRLGVKPLRERKSEVKDEIVRVMNFASRLPALTRESKGAWFQHVKELLLAFNGGPMRKNKIFFEIGKHAKEKYYNRLKKEKTKSELDEIKMRGSAKGTGDANVEDAIFTELRGAFKALIPKAIAAKTP